MRRVRLHCFRIPFRTTLATAAGASSCREGILFRIETETGESGLGEASLLPQARERFGILIAAARETAAEAIGMDIDAILDSGAVRAAPTAAFRAAWAGLETAAWDVKARSRSMGLAAVLTANPLSAVAVNALVSAEDPLVAASEAALAREHGFGTVKLKVGMASALPEECRRVAGVRRALGPAVRLRVDANGAWDLERAIETIEALSSLDIEYVEQPVFGLAALRRVSAAVSVPIAADEDLTNMKTAKQFIRAGAVQVVVLKPVQLGGVVATLSLAAMARAAGLTPVVTSSIDSGVGIAAALQIAAAVRTPLAAGLATAELLACDLTEQPIAVERGVMKVPAGGGIGVDLDESALTKFITHTLVVDSPR